MKEEKHSHHHKIQKIIRDCCKQLYNNELDNPENMDRFLKNMHFEVLNLNKLITSSKIESVIKIPLTPSMSYQREEIVCVCMYTPLWGIMAIKIMKFIENTKLEI